MKIKAEFITNSSCASFIILKKNISEKQIDMINNHIVESSRYIVSRGPQTQIYNRPQDAWKIEETEESIEGSVSMDNFDMMWFLIKIGVNEDDVELHGCYGD